MSGWPSRAVARSTRGMVASPHAQATAAGVDVLRRGGNAIDAAIATNAVLSVVYPPSCGIGGDALWIVFDARAQRAYAYNGSGRTPRAASLERLGGTLPERGALSVTVPGAVRSWEDVARIHGTRDLDELLAPAERYARDGYAATDVVVAYCAINAELLAREEAAARLFLPGGTAPRPGDVLRNPELAATLAAIRQGGADAFYGGEIGARLVAALNRRGNVMTEADLGEHTTDRVDPLRMPWQDGELLMHPPNSQAACFGIALGIASAAPVRDEIEWTHVAIEATKRALTWRKARCADPAFGATGVEEELTEAAFAAARRQIDDRAGAYAAAVDGGDTIACVAADDAGNAVTLIESLYMNFGSGVVAEGTGVVFHNRGTCFSLDPSHPNAYAPGKRPMHTLSPPMFLEGGRPSVVFGTMGGDGQPQILTQFLHHHRERGLDVQRALDEPRWIVGRPSIPGRPDVASKDAVVVESRFDAAHIAALERRGHPIVPLGPYENAMGHAHAIAIDRERGTFAGGADPRADSAALGP